MADAWGGSWGLSWDDTWGEAAVVVIPPQPELPISGGAGSAGHGAYRKAWQREFDRQRAREEGITLRQYLDQIEAKAEQGKASERSAIAKAAADIRAALDHEIELTGLAERLAEAAALQQIALLKLLMQEVARIALERQRAIAMLQQAAMLDQMRRDDALATLLLLM